MITEPRRTTLLLVDDEDGLRAIARDILQLHGYRVFDAPSGARGLEIYRQFLGEIDVVVLDLAMPEMDGRETYEHLLAMDPGVKVILASGYAAGRDAVDLLNRGVRAFIEKPYRIEELNATIERVAAGGRVP